MSRPTRGSEAFRKVCDRRTQVVVAGELGKKLGRKIYQGSVSDWLLGKHQPSTDVTIACQQLYRIPLAWWLEVARRSARRAA